MTDLKAKLISKTKKFIEEDFDAGILIGFHADEDMTLIDASAFYCVNGEMMENAVKGLFGQLEAAGVPPEYLVMRYRADGLKAKEKQRDAAYESIQR